MKVTLIIPDKTNEGGEWERGIVLNTILAHAGGFTLYPASGYWRDDTTGQIYIESVSVLVCEGQEDTPETRHIWRGLAELVRFCASQISVYLQFGDESPEFVTAESVPELEEVS